MSWTSGSPSKATGLKHNDFILETKQLTREFKGFIAVDGVNLQIKRGSIHALIGPNGAGKTTVFNLLTKFLPVSSGQIIYNGQDITALKAAEVARMGMVRSFQISAVFPHLSVLENVRIGLQRKLGTSFHFWKSESTLNRLNEQAMHLLEQVDLGSFAQTQTVELPYGRKRALEIATTLALDPELMQDGLEQADLVATEAAKLGAEVLISSPLKRTKQTAEAISRTTGLEIIFDESWYELSFGTWDGRSTEEVRAEEPDQYQAWLNSTAYAPGGGESYDEASIRIEEALEKLVAEYPGKKICVVTHNGIIKTALAAAMKVDTTAIFNIDVSPCSISSISIWPSDNLMAIRSTNERGHLRV